MAAAAVDTILLDPPRGNPTNILREPDAALDRLNMQMTPFELAASGKGLEPFDPRIGREITFQTRWDNPKLASMDIKDIIVTFLFDLATELSPIMSIERSSATHFIQRGIDVTRQIAADSVFKTPSRTSGYGVWEKEYKARFEQAGLGGDLRFTDTPEGRENFAVRIRGIKADVSTEIYLGALRAIVTEQPGYKSPEQINPLGSVPNTVMQALDQMVRDFCVTNKARRGMHYALTCAERILGQERGGGVTKLILTPRTYYNAIQNSYEDLKFSATGAEGVANSSIGSFQPTISGYPIYRVPEGALHRPNDTINILSVRRAISNYIQYDMRFIEHIGSSEYQTVMTERQMAYMGGSWARYPFLDFLGHSFYFTNQARRRAGETDLDIDLLDKLANYDHYLSYCQNMKLDPNSEDVKWGYCPFLQPVAGRREFKVVKILKDLLDDPALSHRTLHFIQATWNAAGIRGDEVISRALFLDMAKRQAFIPLSGIILRPAAIHETDTMIALAKAKAGRTILGEMMETTTVNADAKQWHAEIDIPHTSIVTDPKSNRVVYDISGGRYLGGKEAMYINQDGEEVTRELKMALRTLNGERMGERCLVAVVQRLAAGMRDPEKYFNIYGFWAAEEWRGRVKADTDFTGLQRKWQCEGMAAYFDVYQIALPAFASDRRNDLGAAMRTPIYNNSVPAAPTLAPPHDMGAFGTGFVSMTNSRGYDAATHKLKETVSYGPFGREGPFMFFQQQSMC